MAKREYHHIIHKVNPVAARTLEKAITTILYVPYVATRLVKYATTEIKSRNTKLSHIRVIFAFLIYSKILW